jgi:hypothetical protein
MIERDGARAETFKSMADQEPTICSVGLAVAVAAIRADAASYPATRAMLKNNLGNMLPVLGRATQALEAARESVELYGTLHAALPQAYIQKHRMSLRTLITFARKADDQTTANEVEARLRAFGD